MDAICLVCESAYEVEGELDLLVQIECPKCHNGVLMLDAEDESDITHFADVASSGIFDTSPPEPLDVAASVLLGASYTSQDRWVAQAEDVSQSREIHTTSSMLTDTDAHDPRKHDNIQTVDSNPIDSAALALYNSEPEDLSRTLPEIPNPYAIPLSTPSPVPFKEMVGEEDDDTPKAPDTEVEMMPYGTGTAVDLPSVQMSGESTPEPSADPFDNPLVDQVFADDMDDSDDPLNDLEGMLDNAITSLASLPAVTSPEPFGKAPSTFVDHPTKPTPQVVATQEHPSFDEAFSVQSPQDTQDTQDTPDDFLEAALTLHNEPDAAATDAADADAALPPSGNESTSQDTIKTFASSDFEDPTDGLSDPPEAIEVTVTSHDINDNIDALHDDLPLAPFDFDSLSVLLPDDQDKASPAQEALEDSDKAEASDGQQITARSRSDIDDKDDEDSEESGDISTPTADDEAPEVAIHSQILDDSPLADLALAEIQEAQPPHPSTSANPSVAKPLRPGPYEPHELEPLHPVDPSQIEPIDPDAFSFENNDKESRQTRPLRPVQHQLPQDLLDEADSPSDAADSDAGNLALDDNIVNVNVGIDDLDIDTIKDRQPAKQIRTAALEAPEPASKTIDTARFKPEAPSGEMLAPQALALTTEKAPARARTFSLAPPIETTSEQALPLAPKQELNRTLAFGVQLPEDLPQQEPASPAPAPKKHTLEATPQAESAKAESAKAESAKAESAKDEPVKSSPDTTKKAAEKAAAQASKSQPGSSSNALPMAGFDKAPQKQTEPPPKAAQEPQSEPPQQDGMIDFDNLSADFFDSPVQDKSHGAEHFSDLDELIQQGAKDNNKLLMRVAIAVPVLIGLVILLFWAINRQGAKDPNTQGQVTKRTPVKRLKPLVQAQTKRVTPRTIGTPAIVDAGAGPDGSARPTLVPDGGVSPDAPGSPDAGAGAANVPETAAPDAAPERVIPPPQRTRRRPPPRRLRRRRPPPRRTRRRRPPRRRRTYNRAAAKRSFQRGQKQLFAGNIKGAIQEYKRANRSDPRYAPAYRALGAAYMRQGNKSAAKRAWRTFLRLKPNDPMAKFIRKMIR